MHPTYTYDLTGNRTMTGYATGTGNQMTNDGVYTYTYDANGNTTKKSKGASAETWTFGYDNRNQMLWAKDSATDGGTLISVATYTYDVFGRLAEEDQTVGTTTTVTRHAWDGQNSWADLNGSNALVMRYIHGDQVNELLAREDASGTVNWFGTDRQLSVTIIVSAAGASLDTITYDGFQNIVNETSPSVGGNYKGTGVWFDSETGNQIHGWRLESNGRWLTRDPKGFAAGDTNLYRPEGDNPTNGTDPTGLKVVLEVKPVRWHGLLAGHHVEIVWSSSNGWVTFDGGGETTHDPDHPGRPLPIRDPAYAPADSSNWNPLPLPNLEDPYDVVSSPYKSAEEELAALDKAYSKLVQLPYHRIGSNSNTYAKQLLTNAGFTVRDLYTFSATGREVLRGPTAAIGWDNTEYGGDGSGYNKTGMLTPASNTVPVGDIHGRVFANRDVPKEWETFQLVDLGNGKVAIHSHAGYFCAEEGGGSSCYANRAKIGAWETWILEYNDDNTVSFKSRTGYYLCAELGSGTVCNANRPEKGPWERFHMEPAKPTFGENFHLKTSDSAEKYVTVEK